MRSYLLVAAFFLSVLSGCSQPAKKALNGRSYNFDGITVLDLNGTWHQMGMQYGILAEEQIPVVQTKSVSFAIFAEKRNRVFCMNGNIEFMRLAIEEAKFGIRNGHGGPFGSIIVKDGRIVGRGHNRVLADNDPTCHGEVAAIRDACSNLRTFDLTGCEIYTTGEPCHMCLCACMWANISKIYYGCAIADNERIGFRDGRFNNIFGGREELGDFLVECDRAECLALFDEYLASGHSNY